MTSTESESGSFPIEHMVLSKAYRSFYPYTKDYLTVFLFINLVSS